MWKMVTLPDVIEELVLRVLGKLGQVKQFQHQRLYAHKHASITYFCLEFIPGGLVDVGMPHLLIAVQLLAFTEGALQIVHVNDASVQQLERVRTKSFSSQTSWEKQHRQRHHTYPQRDNLLLMITVSQFMLHNTESSHSIPRTVSWCRT